MVRSHVSVAVALVLALLAVSAPALAGAVGAETGGAAAREPTGVRGAELTTGMPGAEPTTGFRAAGQTTANQSAQVCAGTVAEPADALTLVSVQGARFGPNGANKTDARLIAFGPRGEIEWVYRSGADHDVVWSYDVDPLPNGNVFVTATKRGSTLLFELDPATGERVWSEELPFVDTHDADLIDDRHVAIANMRNYDAENETNDDRLVIYDRKADEIVWEWRFADHYDRSVGGEYTEDWTHLNDVDRVGNDSYLLSPRNFDQVILVNRTSGEIEMTLGSDDDFSVLKKQHNPDYLESESGRPTILVADSENTRITEYERRDGAWNRTWTLESDGTMEWPRDADRLRNGNTLVTDSRNNRVVEVTPDGEVVWEVYGPWLVYDAERLPVDGSRGPTATDMSATGTVTLTDAPPGTDRLERCSAAIDEFEGGFGVDDGPTNDPGQATTDGGTSGESKSAGESDSTGESDDTAGPVGVRTGPPGGVVAGVVLTVLLVGVLAAAVRRVSSRRR